MTRRLPDQSVHVVRAKALMLDCIRTTPGSSRAKVLIDFVAALETGREVAAGLAIVCEWLARHRRTVSLDDLRRNVLALWPRTSTERRSYEHPRNRKQAGGAM